MTESTMNAGPQQPEVIVFDFGGVLLDWNPRHLYRKLIADEAEMERFLAEVCTPAWNLQQDAGRSFADAVAELTAQFPAQAELIRAYDARWSEMIRGPIAGTIAILEELSTAGYPLYGLTNWSAEKFAETQPRYPFFQLFEHIVVSGAVKLIKPNPRIYQLLLERIGRPASACLFIDDSVPNVEAAQRLGFDAVHFESPDQLRAKLAQRWVLAEGM
jgi:2-haloacid dehalogenase